MVEITKLVRDRFNRYRKKILRLNKEKAILIEEANRFKRQRDDQIEKTMEAQEQYALFKDNYKRLLYFYNDHQGCEGRVVKKGLIP